MNLLLLVKQYPVYVNNLALFPDLAGKLALEKATPTVKTQALKAVLAQVDALPVLVVESQGSTDEPAHFSTLENWHSLALDVLNLMYVLPAGLMSHQSFAVTSPKAEKFLIRDDMHKIARNSLRK